MKRRLIIRNTCAPRGVALAICVLLLALLLLLSLGLLGISQRESTIATNDVDMVRALYAAEAGLESGFQQLRGLVANNGGVVTDAQLGTIGAPTLTSGSLSSRITLTLQTQRGNPAGAPAYVTTLDSGAYRGLAATVQDYLLTSTATHTNPAKATRVALSQVVQYGRIPLFQFGIFYGRGVDLEIFPGPPMNFAGRVHANGNIYLRPQDQLTFDSYMTAVGNIYRYQKNDPTDRGTGTAKVKDASGTYQVLNFDHTSNVGFGGSWTADQWKAQALSTFTGKVLDSSMSVPEIVPPVPGLFYNPSNPDAVAHEMIERGVAGDTDAMKNAKSYYQAGLLIIDGAPKVWSGGSLVSPGWNLSSCSSGTVSTQTFTDARQGKTMSVTQVDVGKLNACGKMPANGILYVSKTQSGSDDQGVRLINGATLPSGGLTVVSDNPLYIKGDYNTVNKQPAAILADAFTMLSNNWSDSNSNTGNMNDRVASQSTLNAALAMGPSKESVVGSEAGGASNGGAHNVIRFLENWGGVNFTFSGSLVALWHSEHARGDYKSGSASDYYSPPNRIWSYDTSLSTAQPPGTPFAVLLIRRAWVKM